MLKTKEKGFFQLSSIRISAYCICIMLFTCLSSGRCFAQGKDNKLEKDLVQLSGIVTSQRIGPVPFATVKIKNTFRGTVAAQDGFYSFVVREKDTVEYSAVGFKKILFIIPSNVKDQKLTNNPNLERDTLTFPEMTTVPWPTREQFRAAFLNIPINDAYAENARKNMDPETLGALYEQMAKDGGENQQIVLQQIANCYYYSGGQKNYSMLGANATPVPTSLLNPFAWAQFFNAIKDGKFKKKKEKK